MQISYADYEKRYQSYIRRRKLVKNHAYLLESTATKNLYLCDLKENNTENQTNGKNNDEQSIDNLNIKDGSVDSGDVQSIISVNDTTEFPHSSTSKTLDNPLCDTQSSYSSTVQKIDIEEPLPFQENKNVAIPQSNRFTQTKEDYLYYSSKLLQETKLKSFNCDDKNLQSKNAYENFCSDVIQCEKDFQKMLDFLTSTYQKKLDSLKVTKIKFQKYIITYLFIIEKVRCQH